MTISRLSNSICIVGIRLSRSNQGYSPVGLLGKLYWREGKGEGGRDALTITIVVSEAESGLHGGRPRGRLG